MLSKTCACVYPEERLIDRDVSGGVGRGAVGRRCGRNKSREERRECWMALLTVHLRGKRSLSGSLHNHTETILHRRIPVRSEMFAVVHPSSFSVNAHAFRASMRSPSDFIGSRPDCWTRRPNVGNLPTRILRTSARSTSQHYSPAELPAGACNFESGGLAVQSLFGVDTDCASSFPLPGQKSPQGGLRRKPPGQTLFGFAHWRVICQVTSS